eukprot:8622668-Pyramimonas_sp.AAC.1
MVYNPPDVSRALLTEPLRYPRKELDPPPEGFADDFDPVSGNPKQVRVYRRAPETGRGCKERYNRCGHGYNKCGHDYYNRCGYNRCGQATPRGTLELAPRDASPCGAALRHRRLANVTFQGPTCNGPPAKSSTTNWGGAPNSP